MEAIGEVVTDNGSEVKGAFAELLRRLNIHKCGYPLITNKPMEL